MKRFFTLIMTLIPLFPAVAFADEPIPDKGTERISWAVQCCKGAPKGMYITAVILAALIIVSVIYYRRLSGGEK